MIVINAWGGSSNIGNFDHQGLSNKKVRLDGIDKTVLVQKYVQDLGFTKIDPTKGDFSFEFSINIVGLDLPKPTVPVGIGMRVQNLNLHDGIRSGSEVAHFDLVPGPVIFSEVLLQGGSDEQHFRTLYKSNDLTSWNLELSEYVDLGKDNVARVETGTWTFGDSITPKDFGKVKNMTLTVGTKFQFYIHDDNSTWDSWHFPLIFNFFLDLLEVRIK